MDHTSENEFRNNDGGQGGKPGNGKWSQSPSGCNFEKSPLMRGLKSRVWKSVINFMLPSSLLSFHFSAYHLCKVTTHNSGLRDRVTQHVIVVV